MPPHAVVAFEKQKYHRSHHPVERGGRENQGAAAAAAPATRRAKKNGAGNGGGGGGGGGGLKSTRSIFLQHGAALARQRLKRQEEIERENARMERRLKVIREANPGHYANGPRRVSAPGVFGRRCSGGVGDDAGRPSREQRRHHCLRPQRDGAILAGGRRYPVGGGREEAHRPGSISGGGCGGDGQQRHGPGAKFANNGGHANKGEREAEWRELYRRREALASAVKREAAGVAGRRAQVEALRAKTLCTEANARRCAAA